MQFNTRLQGVVQRGVKYLASRGGNTAAHIRKVVPLGAILRSLPFHNETVYPPVIARGHTREILEKVEVDAQRLLRQAGKLLAAGAKQSPRFDVCRQLGTMSVGGRARGISTRRIDNGHTEVSLTAGGQVLRVILNLSGAGGPIHSIIRETKNGSFAGSHLRVVDLHQNGTPYMAWTHPHGNDGRRSFARAANS